MSQTPQDTQNTAPPAGETAANSTGSSTGDAQVTDAQLAQVTGGKAGGRNIQGTRLEDLSNRTVGQPETIENIEEISI